MCEDSQICCRQAGSTVFHHKWCRGAAAAFWGAGSPGISSSSTRTRERAVDMMHSPHRAAHQFVHWNTLQGNFNTREVTGNQKRRWHGTKAESDLITFHRPDYWEHWDILIIYVLLVYAQLPPSRMFVCQQNNEILDGRHLGQERNLRK